jgi:hypothetical protein
MPQPIRINFIYNSGGYKSDIQSALLKMTLSDNIVDKK